MMMMILHVRDILQATKMSILFLSNMSLTQSPCILYSKNYVPSWQESTVAYNNAMRVLCIIDSALNCTCIYHDRQLFVELI